MPIAATQHLGGPFRQPPNKRLKLPAPVPNGSEDVPHAV